MKRSLTDLYFGGNRLKEVGPPVAGTDAANKAYVDGLGPVIYHFDGTDMTDSAGNTVTAQTIAAAVDAGKAVMVLSSEGKLYTLSYAETTGSPLMLNFSLIHDNIEHLSGPRVNSIYYDEDEGWVTERTYLWNRVFYGITNTPESTPTKTVELIEPQTGWYGGNLLLLQFTYGVPAGYGNAISVGGATYGLTFHQYGITTAGVINAGDKVLLYCYNNVAHVIAIDRWGSAISPTYTLHNTSINTASSTTTVTCAANERAFHLVQVGAANCTLCINILNGCDNTVIISGTQPVNIVVLQNGLPVVTNYEMHDYFDGHVAYLTTKVRKMKFVISIVGGEAVVDVDIMDVYNPSV